MENPEENIRTWIPVCLPMEVKSDIVHVWRFDLNQTDGIISDLEKLLSYDEHVRANLFRFRTDRLRFIVARATLRRILAQCLRVDPHFVRFGSGPYGKPCILGETLQFNVSYSGHFGLIVVAQGRNVGVDIERIHSFPGAAILADQFFSVEESRKMSLITNWCDRSFFECWTRKEAFIKATGKGLSHPLDTFEVTFYPDHNVELKSRGVSVTNWVLYDLTPAIGYCGALVIEQGEKQGPPTKIALWELVNFK